MQQQGKNNRPSFKKHRFFYILFFLCVPFSFSSSCLSSLLSLSHLSISTLHIILVYLFFSFSLFITPFSPLPLSVSYFPSLTLSPYISLFPPPFLFSPFFTFSSFILHLFDPSHYVDLVGTRFCCSVTF